MNQGEAKNHARLDIQHRKRCGYYIPTEKQNCFHSLLEEFDKLSSIKDPLQKQHELSQAAERSYLDKESFIKLFNVFEHKQKEKNWLSHWYSMPFAFMERRIEWTAAWLNELDILKVFQQIGNITVVFAVASLIFNALPNREKEIEEAWKVLESEASGRRTRYFAIQKLHEYKQPLDYIYLPADTYLTDIQLSKAQLNQAKLSQVILQRANLQEAQLKGANLERAILEDADLSGVDLSDANLSDANLEGVNLEGANLSDANLEGANLEGANLSDANLEGANLGLANLSQAILRRANMTSAYITLTNLSGANLYQANLQQALFQGGNLRGANLAEANLQQAHIKGTDLTEVNLAAANLKGSKIIVSINATATEVIKDLHQYEKQIKSACFWQQVTYSLLESENPEIIKKLAELKSPKAKPPNCSVWDSP